MKASVDANVLHVDWAGPRLFGAKLGRFVAKAWRDPAGGKTRVSGCLAQAHARNIENEGLACGAGIGQLGQRHLLYVGARNGRPHLSLWFCWLTRERP